MAFSFYVYLCNTIYTKLLKKKKKSFFYLQTPPLAKQVMYGGKEGKSYAVIINTNLSKREIVKKTTDYLVNFQFVDKKDLHLDEINSKTAEYVVPFEFPQLWYISGVYNMNPLVFRADIRFEFHSNGNVMIVAQDLDSYLLTLNKTYYDKPEQRSKYAKKYYEDAQLYSASKGPFSKFLVWGNLGLDGMSEFYRQSDEYFQNLSENYHQILKLEATGEGLFLNYKEIVAEGSKVKLGGNEKYRQHQRDLAGRDALAGMTNARWEKAVRPDFDRLFKQFATALGGQIQGVAEDGEQTWTLVDGKVLPVDPKQQKKYLKDGLTY